MGSYDNSTSVETPLVFFGPQRHISDRLADIQRSILKKPTLKLLKDIVRDIPVLWKETIQPSCNIFAHVSGAQKLQRLVDFIERGEIDHLNECDNILLAPLTILGQIVDYICLGPADQVQGFCIGFLTAASVSGSRHAADLEKWIGSAIRLAICIGAVIDAGEILQPSASACSSAYSIRLVSDEQKEYLDRLLTCFPKAYVSCVTDIDRITITVADGDFPVFSQRLQNRKLSLQPVGLRGRYHTNVPGREEALKQLKSLCQENPLFQLPSANELVFPLRSNADGKVINSGFLHDIALDSILVHQCQWYETVRATIDEVNSHKLTLVSVGSGVLPSSLIATTKGRIPSRKAANGTTYVSISRDKASMKEETVPVALDTSSGAIAVIGMACRYPEAENLDEFWELITSGRNAVGPLPWDRFEVNDLWRSPKGPFWGNFMKDPGAFDHRFFNISAREAVSMDPQQRLVLQVVYEALESAGYSAGLPGGRVGCYMGVGSVDYEANIASENASAYSATGTLRAFISGRASHQFGWTGPSVTIDTACSSSAVAIHHACKAIRTNNCSIAIAGGVNVITSPTLFQNLAAASFLSPTGASKAFDAHGDGYCRGEGAGILVLKPLAQAIADCDAILGTIPGTAVTSQSDLYYEALSFAGISPDQVSYVEAHGTGTPVGDPIECDSIRRAFGGLRRRDVLTIGSVKDVIGHTEASSGVAGCIKTLLMIQHGTIPKQPNFTQLNPNIVNLGPDKLAIATKTVPWQHHVSERIALVNNYGAAGSNAAIVLQGYDANTKVGSRPATMCDVVEYPFFLSAKTAEALRTFSSALKGFVSSEKAPPLGDIAWNLAHKQNPAFGHFAAFSSASVPKLLQELGDISMGSSRHVLQRESSPKPTVLCFGGQTGRRIYLSQHMVEESPLLKAHLDECDAVLRELGLPELYPRIYDQTPIEHLVPLHAMLFCVQYASAKAWLDAGLQVCRLIGHSFGQLTALCVAGSMSLADSLRLVTDRAALIEELWGPDPGMMLSIEGDDEIIEKFIQNVAKDVDVACYNAPRNVVVAGSKASVENVERTCNEIELPRMKISRLGNSHAYHSHLTDPILDKLLTVAESIEWRIPSIPVETCSRRQSWERVDAAKIVEHTRDPVYFGEAVHRISGRYPGCVWLEAGSASPIITMVRRALPKEALGSHVFLPVDLGRGNPWSSLSQATSGLWSASCKARFWPFIGQHALNRYKWLNLPPYQFAKTNHWISHRSFGPQTVSSPTPMTLNGTEELIQLLYNHNGEALFAISTCHNLFAHCVNGHAVLDQSLCPASMYFELAIQAANILGESPCERVPMVEQLQIMAPLTVGMEGGLFLSMTSKSSTPQGWAFTLFTSMEPSPSSQITTHAQGHIHLLEPKSRASRFSSLQRLLGASRYDQIALSPEANRLSGDMVYKVFGSVVSYASYFQNVRNVSALNREVVGDVVVPKVEPSLSTASDPLAVDNFLQVAGIHVNCMSEVSDKEDTVYVCTSIGEVLWRNVAQSSTEPHRKWKVYSNMEIAGGKNVLNDILVLDSLTGAVVMSILGAEFTAVSHSSLRKVLAKLNGNTVRTKPISKSLSRQDGRVLLGRKDAPPSTPIPIESSGIMGHNIPADGKTHDSTTCGVDSIQAMLSEVLGVDRADVEPESSLVDLGVDSLLGTEVENEIKTRFGIKIPSSTLQGMLSVQSLAEYLASTKPNSAVNLQQTKTYGRSSTAGATAGTHNPPDVSVSMNGFDGITQAEDADETSKISNRIEQDSSEPFRGIAIVARTWFNRNQNSYDTVIQESHLENFRERVYPHQAELVITYITEALAAMGCSLATMRVGQSLPEIEYLPRHTRVVSQLFAALERAQLVTDGMRTDKALPQRCSAELFEAIVRAFPQHAAEHQLLHVTGSRLADCLSGRADALPLLFRDAQARRLLEEVYTNAPMFKAGTLFLARFLKSVLDQVRGTRKLRVLELGAGTGGTTSLLLEQLKPADQDLTYTFTDLSPSLVAAAKKKFSQFRFMEYATLDIEQSPAAHLMEQYDVIISTNCIHATRDLNRSCSHIRKMLRQDGIVCLVELTQNLFWFDLVFGLLEGWWLFEDGRRHALASESSWQQVLLSSGYNWVDWSDGTAQESSILRLIVASPLSSNDTLQQHPVSAHHLTNGHNQLETQETVLFKEADGLPLYADIHYPEELQNGTAPRPIALMLHGGGHVLLSRKDVRPKQTGLLLNHGFIPVSVDYRLCPETTLLEGPMTDVRDALGWARRILPFIKLKRSDVVISGDTVVAVGWSTGGHLALTMGWTAPAVGIEPPQATLCFYCPIDYEDEFWKRPNLPFGDDDHSRSVSLWDGVRDTPIVSYNPPQARGGWMNKEDSRSRIALHMNWYGMTLPMLIHGLKNKSNRAKQGPPSFAPVTREDIQAISPLAQVRKGSYNTPNFIIHPENDDLIPWQQVQRTAEEMARRGIEVQFRLVRGANHLFDMHPRYEERKEAKQAVIAGYEFLASHV
ncbi:hypothetical protein F5Y19DRAFT_489120 [Xylariaceae sp. FL1651]|nr:hypothetical protein F5Y19DRAFT_489120 [Xylariaceae sp. FL1651]